MHSNHPANRMLRLVLEIAGLIAAFQWGWQQSGMLRYLFALGAPLLLAAVWIFFNVPDDPIPTGQRFASIPGSARFSLELVCCAFVIWAMLSSGRALLAIVFAFAILLHYFWSADRVSWLMRH